MYPWQEEMASVIASQLESGRQFAINYPRRHGRSQTFDAVVVQRLVERYRAGQLNARLDREIFADSRVPLTGVEHLPPPSNHARGQAVDMGNVEVGEGLELLREWELPDDDSEDWEFDEDAHRVSFAAKEADEEIEFWNEILHPNKSKGT